MAITAHFIDDNWTLRNIIMRYLFTLNLVWFQFNPCRFMILINALVNMCRFIYVPAPHTTQVICAELYEALVEWNIDEKSSTITLDNCTTNDAVILELIKNIGKPKLMLEGKLLHM
jgi:hypothetical protein